MRAFLAALLALLGALGAARADAPRALVFSARVADRHGKAIVGLRVRLEARLSGRAVDWQGRSRLWFDTVSGRAATGADGVARWRVPPPPFADREWFDGEARVRAETADAARETTTLASEAGADEARLTLFEEPDTAVEGFPVWLGADGRLDRVLVLLESFDSTNRFSATDNARFAAAAADPLRRAGIDLLVVSYPDPYLAPDRSAPLVERAVRAAARASGRPVAIAALSISGIVARWALVSAEERGAPLPVALLVLADSPNRGGHLRPELQAIVLRYAPPVFRRALQSEAAAALLTERVADARRDVRWKTIGLGPLGFHAPSAVHASRAAHEAFFARLRALNGRGGYPTRCRVVALANSARRESRPPGAILRVWLPLAQFWNLKADAADCQPGSLLPQAVSGFSLVLPFGLAGASFAQLPTFIPAASALDAGPEETPPFASWYARPEGLPPLPHDVFDPGAIRFVVREVVRAFSR